MHLARSLQRVATTPMGVGFFGLSQAGKSYLILSLAAGQNERLETLMGGRRVDFLKHVNPAGVGKEATGLVTRFSRHAKASDDETLVNSLAMLLPLAPEEKQALLECATLSERRALLEGLLEYALHAGDHEETIQ